MPTTKRPSDRSIFIASALIILGRIGLIAAVCQGLCVFFFDIPWDPVRLWLVFSISLVLLIVGARLVRAYLWLIDTFVQSIAFGTLILAAVIARHYFGRAPFFLTAYEISILALCLMGFGASVFWLRRRGYRS